MIDCDSNNHFLLHKYMHNNNYRKIVYNSFCVITFKNEKYI